MALRRKGMTQTALAEALGITQGSIGKIFSGIAPGRKHMRRIGEILEVPLEWLTVGENPPAWVAGSVLTPPVKILGGSELTPPTTRFPAGSDPRKFWLALVGEAAAGPAGQAARWDQMAEPEWMDAPNTWVAVQISGMSAYPVAYPGQFVIIDTGRTARPADLDAETLEDLHDNLCLIVTIESGTPQSYCKRFCVDSRAPAGFCLASVDSGRSSPYLPPDIIEQIIPVVGVLFQDPRLPRKKGRNQATITI